MHILRHAAYPVLTALLVLAVNAYVQSHPLYRDKTRKVDEQLDALAELSELSADRPITLFVGNSYVRTSVQPSSEPTDARFIINGLPLADVPHVLRSLPDGLRVGTVVVGLGYNYATPPRSLAYVYRRHETKNPVARLWWSIPVARSYSLSSTLVKNDLLCLTLGKSCRDAGAKAQSFERRADDSEAHARRIEAEVRRRLREYRPFTSEVSPSFGEDLRAIHDECARLGARMVTFTAPIYSGLRRELDPAVLERFRKTAASVSPYVDYNERYPDWSAAYFADPTHVDAQGPGARLVTRDLRGLLR
jgi:predicted DNA-binding WGR domain protein